MESDLTRAAEDVDDLVRLLAERVAARRAAGLYPPGLEEQLELHGRRVAADRYAPPDHVGALREALGRLERARVVEERAPATSRVPLGGLVHRVLARLQARQLDQVYAQVRELAEATLEVGERTLRALEEPAAHEHEDLLEQLDALFARLSEVDRSDASAVLDERVRALEGEARRSGFAAPYTNEAFEARFRGSQQELREHLRPLALDLAGLGPVLDIGCGQGALLEEIVAAGGHGRGVELDAGLVAVCRAKGLDVIQGDGLAVLAEADPASLGAVTAIQVVEHLQPGELSELVLTAAAKLQPGGVLALETPNPQSLYVFARAFYLDPTHKAPVHPAYLHFLCEQAGFSGVQIRWLSPVAEDEALVDDGSENVARLQRLLFAPQDYLLLAIR